MFIVSNIVKEPWFETLLLLLNVVVVVYDATIFSGSLCENPIGNVDDDKTLVEVDAKADEPLKPIVSGEDLEDMETRMQELVVRVASLETAMARQQRRDLIILLLLGVYLLAKLGRPLLRN